MPAAHPPEFRRRAPDLVARGNLVAQTARDLGISESCLRNGMSRDEIDSGRNKGTTSPNRVGNGSTMDAIRSELATGAPTGGRMHITKGQESLRGLENFLNRNPDALYGDRLVAKSLADELLAVLPR